MRLFAVIVGCVLAVGVVGAAYAASSFWNETTCVGHTDYIGTEADCIVEHRADAQEAFAWAFSPLAPFEAEVLWVHDGDTLNVDRHGAREAIRLYGVLAPEKRKAGGAEAAQALVDLIGDAETVTVIPCFEIKKRNPGKGVEFETRTHGRLVAQIVVDGENVNEALIDRGYTNAGDGAGKTYKPCLPEEVE